MIRVEPTAAIAGAFGPPCQGCGTQPQHWRTFVFDPQNRPADPPAAIVRNGLRLRLCRSCESELHKLARRRRDRLELTWSQAGILRFLAKQPARRGSLAAIGEGTGGYATNPLRSLVGKRFVVTVGDGYGSPPIGPAAPFSRNDTFELTDAGAAAVLKYDSRQRA